MSALREVSMKLEVRRAKSPQGSGINWRAFFPPLNPVRPPPRILSPHAPPYSRANAEPTVPPVGGRCARWTTVRQAQRSFALRCANYLRHRGQQGCRRSLSTPSSWRVQASPTRPEEPSLALVGRAQGHGRRYRIRAASSAGRRRRPIFLTHM